MAEGAVQFEVERFGLTANNLTYAVFANTWRYWDFFPAPPGWGRILVWGFGRVSASGVDGVAAGTRFYGYWPMSSRVTLQVTAGAGGLVESSAAHAYLPAVYNRYLPALPQAGFPPELDDAAAVVRPLFLTGWLIADLPDDQVDALQGPRSRPGRRGGQPRTRAAIHLATRVLRASVMVGATHWTGASFEGSRLPGPEPVLFFAPSVADEGAAALGQARFARQVGPAWSTFATTRLPGLIDIRHATGGAALATAYAARLDGDVDPREGRVFSL